MQKPPMVHAAGAQSVAALQQQQQITQQPAALNSGKKYFPSCSIHPRVPRRVFEMGRN